MQRLDKTMLKERLSPFLTKEEIRTLEKRRQALIRHIQELIEKHGEPDVIVRR